KCIPEVRPDVPRPHLHQLLGLVERASGGELLLEVGGLLTRERHGHTLEPGVDGLLIDFLSHVPPLIEERHHRFVLYSRADGVRRLDDPAELVHRISIRLLYWRAREA